MAVDAAIGVFDSGVGGLTVLRALRERMPRESFVYLGDTARLPYGTKGEHTVVRYAEQAAARLVERGIKLLVVACNTASAVALPALSARFAPLPVLGVVQPGAQAACEATQNGQILVIATEGTVSKDVYKRAILSLDPDASVQSVPAGLFVALAEEGWTEGPIVEAVARRYLGPYLAPGGPDCLVLGCTHFPVFANTLANVVGSGLRLVDSAQTTAKAVEAVLLERDLACAQSRRGLTLMATDSPQRFAKVGPIFLGDPMRADDIELVDL